MLFLTFRIGRDWYALDAAHVVEVLPRVACKKIPHAPPAVAGVFSYHGMPVPVVDLPQLAAGTPARDRMSTRIVLIHFDAENNSKHLLGLLAEEATGTMRREQSDFVDAGVTADGAPYLGRVTKDERGLIQLVEPGKLLPESICELLFRNPRPTA